MVEKPVRLLEAVRSPNAARLFRYRLYGLDVASDIAVPVSSPATGRTDVPDLVIRRVDGAVPPLPDGPAAASVACRIHGADMFEFRSPEGIVIWLRSIGTFRIAPDTTTVDVYPDREVDQQTLGLALGGPICLFIRHRRGAPSLHASAVTTGRGAVAFLGDRGRGKSTMAASFLHRGAALLTDDALPLISRGEEIQAEPGPPFMKIWDETARHVLELSEALPRLMDRMEKKLLPLDDHYLHAQSPQRLRALYVLNPYDRHEQQGAEITIRALGWREGMLTLLASTSGRPYLLPEEDALALPIYARLAVQAPVRVLRYPRGFEHQGATHRRILADLEAA